MQPRKLSSRLRLTADTWLAIPLVITIFHCVYALWLFKFQPLAYMSGLAGSLLLPGITCLLISVFCLGYIYKACRGKSIPLAAKISAYIVATGSFLLLMTMFSLFGLICGNLGNQGFKCVTSAMDIYDLFLFLAIYNPVSVVLLNMVAIIGLVTLFWKSKTVSQAK